jgi:hypothetical protein
METRPTKIVVSWHAVDAADAELVNTPEQVLADIDRLLEGSHADVGHCGGLKWPS